MGASMAKRQWVLVKAPTKADKATVTEALLAIETDGLVQPR